MFDYLDWWGYLLLGALPGLSFLLGVAWGRRHRGRSPSSDRSSLAQPDTVTTSLIDAVDSVQRQLDELAERQDFSERLLASRPPHAPPQSPAADHRVPTPV